jgi:hypothetical protein
VVGCGRCDHGAEVEQGEQHERRQDPGERVDAESLAGHLDAGHADVRDQDPPQPAPGQTVEGRAERDEVLWCFDAA